jgi:hypothetical protein
MKILGLNIENFLGVRAVDISLRKRVNLFAGHNGAGKSSVQEAVRLALVGEPVRVELKKEFGALVTEGAQHGFVDVSLEDGHAAITLPQGKRTEGLTAPAALPFVLDAQRFARLSVNERRAFLFGLMGLKTDGAAVKQRLLKRGCDAGKVDRVAPLLRAGFEAASKEAKGKATEAKGAWRAVTGETYGSEKAKTWRAEAPAVDAEVSRRLATELQHCDVAIEQWQQQVGKSQGEQQRRAGLRAKLPALQEHASKIARISAKLGGDQQQLAEWEADLKKTAEQAGAAPRVGLVHRLARAIFEAMPKWPGIDQMRGAAWDEVRAALAAYEAEHGPLNAKGGDEKARARLPNIQRSRDIYANSVANDQRDLEAARAALAEAQAIEQELATEFDAAGLEEAQAQATKLKAQRAELVRQIDAQKALKQQADGAERKTKEAAAHAADVAAWDAIGDALAPGGIPSEILAEALDPINERLAQSALDAEWPRVGVEADISITCGGRPYALLSESEQWRADAMLAEAIAHLSGLKLLVLDRFDVLDLKGREDLLAWLDILASGGEIDTALIFGTLKALPSQLPETIDAHWIERGVLGQLKEAA